MEKGKIAKNYYQHKGKHVMKHKDYKTIQKPSKRKTEEKTESLEFEIKGNHKHKKKTKNGEKMENK